MEAVVNLNVRQRLTQVVIFIACVLLSMMVAEVAQGKPKPPRFDKPKYRVVVHTSSQRVVKILYKKRMDGERGSLFASRKGRKRQAAQAETDI